MNSNRTPITLRVVSHGTGFVVERVFPTKWTERVSSIFPDTAAGSIAAHRERVRMLAAHDEVIAEIERDADFAEMERRTNPPVEVPLPWKLREKDAWDNELDDPSFDYEDLDPRDDDRDRYWKEA